MAHRTEDLTPPKIAQILPADAWWALYTGATGTGRYPLVAWGRTEDGVVVGLVAGDNATPVTAVQHGERSSEDVPGQATRTNSFVGYYRTGQRGCAHPRAADAVTFPGDPGWCVTCPGEIRGLPREYRKQVCETCGKVVGLEPYHTVAAGRSIGNGLPGVESMQVLYRHGYCCKGGCLRPYEHPVDSPIPFG